MKRRRVYKTRLYFLQTDIFKFYFYNKTADNEAFPNHRVRFIFFKNATKMAAHVA